MSSHGSGIPLFKVKMAETGRIRDIKKIIARVDGLPGCLNGQRVEFGDGVRGIVMGYDRSDVLILVLGDENRLRMGKEVTGVSEPFTIPVGEGLLGRMVNALGEPLDGKPAFAGPERRPVFCESPSITERTPVGEYLPTGTKAVDAFVPLAKGQRQLVIGDRMTGKTTLAVDAILNQKRTGVCCLYCCVGKAMSSLEKVVGVLHDGGAFDYTLVVVALDNAPVGEQYLAPYAAATMGDYLAAQGRDVLVVFDDITKHAWAYRQLSLLLERAPGREAYPGDIFYIHTQLMERAGRFSERRGGGSMTFLGLVETLEGDLTGYIPSNLISMCDGLIFLNNSIFGEGIRPAVDLALSVSIVGGRAQPAILRRLVRDLRTQYAQYLEITRLSRLQAGSSIHAERLVRRGTSILAALQQPQGRPVTLAEEAAVLHAACEGVMDEMAPERRKAMVEGLHGYLLRRHGALVEAMDGGDELTPSLRKSLDEALTAYRAELGAAPPTEP